MYRSCKQSDSSPVSLGKADAGLRLHDGEQAMECPEFRRLCESDPHNTDVAFARHAASCPACARHLEQLQRLDNLLLRALHVDMPRDRIETTGPGAVWSRRRVVAAAGSLAVAGASGAVLWFALPRPVRALGAEVIAHLYHEPEALDRGRVAIDPAAAQELLAGHAIRINVHPGTISYLRICPFRGKNAAHLVIESVTNRISVMLLPKERVSAVIPITDDEFAGRIVPLDAGSIAIVGHDAAVDHATERRIIQAFEWDA